jgi:hypothetical protein
MFRRACLAVLFVGLSALLAPARDAAPPHLEWAKKAQGRWAYGMYFTGKKVGWTVDEMKLDTHAGKPVLRASSEVFLSTVFDGEKSVKHERTAVYYELTGDGAVVYATRVNKEDGRETTSTAVRDGKKLKITTKQGERIVTRTIDLPRDTIAGQRKLEAWLASGPKPGAKFTKNSLAWDQADLNQEEVYTFGGKKTVKHDGKDVAVFAVVVDVNGGKLKAETFADGRPLTGVIGGLMTFRLEKEADAKKNLDGAALDLMGAVSIVLNRELGLARNVDALTLELTQTDDFKVPASHRQKVKPGKEKGVTIVELKRDFRLEKAAPLSKEQRERYTRTSPRFQCDHEAVRAAAKKVVGGEKDAMKAGQKIVRWVFKELKKSYADNADTALEVLDTKAGDCTEHSLLFVALARAAGIPAREVGGLAYLNGDKPMLAWHAWAEFHDGHQWVSVDPTWNQVYVDGTHLKLSEGSRDLGWANVAGKMKVKVLDVTKRR